MDAQSKEQGLYTIRVEGSIATYQDMGSISSVVAFRTDGDVQDALVTASPGQVAKLHELLRVKSLDPAADGVYVGQMGDWHVVAGGAVTDSGFWALPAP